MHVGRSLLLRDDQSGTNVVKTEPPSSPHVLLSLTTGLDPFDIMAVSTAAVKRLRRHLRGKGVLGGRSCHFPCFRFVEMAGQDGKAKLFYSVVTNFGY